MEFIVLDLGDDVYRVVLNADEKHKYLYEHRGSKRKRFKKASVILLTRYLRDKYGKATLTEVNRLGLREVGSLSFYVRMSENVKRITQEELENLIVSAKKVRYISCRHPVFKGWLR